MFYKQPTSFHFFTDEHINNTVDTGKTVRFQKKVMIAHYTFSRDISVVTEKLEFDNFQEFEK